MASPSAGLSRNAGARPPPAAGAPPSALLDGRLLETTQLDKFVEKALTAGKIGRYALTAAFYRRAVDEALRLHWDTFVCTFLTLRRAACLVSQSCLEGGSREEEAALEDEAWALASSCLPLIVRRMDANTMLPGRGTAVELTFFKRYETTRRAIMDLPTLSTRHLQLAGLSLGYVTAVYAANLLSNLLPSRNNIEAQAFVLRVVDCMLPAARSLTEYTFPDEFFFATLVTPVVTLLYSEAAHRLAPQRCPAGC